MPKLVRPNLCVESVTPHLSSRCCSVNGSFIGMKILVGAAFFLVRCLFASLFVDGKVIHSRLHSYVHTFIYVYTNPCLFPPCHLLRHLWDGGGGEDQREN